MIHSMCVRDFPYFFPSLYIDEELLLAVAMYLLTVWDLNGHTISFVYIYFSNGITLCMH